MEINQKFLDSESFDKCIDAIIDHDTELHSEEEDFGVFNYYEVNKSELKKHLKQYLEKVLNKIA